MHYQQNNQPILGDDLIMLDGGCLFKQYSSDITRLWPINGIGADWISIERES